MMAWNKIKIFSVGNTVSRFISLILCFLVVFGAGCFFADAAFAATDDGGKVTYNKGDGDLTITSSHWLQGHCTYSTSTTATTETVTMKFYFTKDTGWLPDVSGNYTANGKTTTLDKHQGQSSDKPKESITPTGWSNIKVTFTKTTSKKDYTISYKIYASKCSSKVSSGSFKISVPALASYTISYNANGGTGAPSAQTKYYGKTLTLTTAKPTRSASTQYTVTYDANGGSVSTASAKATKTTPYTFSKWNTAAGGGGTSYNSGASYTANSAATLYAQWTTGTATTTSVTLPTPTRANSTATYTINYNANTGNSTGATNNKATVTATTKYTFNGWYTAKSGGTKIGNGGASYKPSANITLYAQWSSTTTVASTTLPRPTKNNTTQTITVTYDKKDGTSSGVVGDKHTTTATSTYTPTGWFSATSGGTKYGNVGASYTPSAATTNMYAQWNTSTTYNKVTLPEAYKPGHIFEGWYTDSALKNKLGNANTSYTPKASITLYAKYEQIQWKSFTTQAIEANKEYTADFYVPGNKTPSSLSFSQGADHNRLESFSYQITSTGEAGHYRVTFASSTAYNTVFIDIFEGATNLGDVVTDTIGENRLFIYDASQDKQTTYDPSISGDNENLKFTEPLTYTTLSADNNWQKMLSRLLLINEANGSPYDYSVVEVPASIGTAYTSIVRGTRTTGFKIVNELRDEKYDIPVKKAWDDNDNDANERPSSVTVELRYRAAGGNWAKYTQDGLANPIQLSDANGWEYQWKGVPKGYYQNDETFVSYEYTVVETSKAIGYQPSVTLEGDSFSDGFRVTNKREQTEVPVYKIWDDDNNGDGTRAESVTFVLTGKSGNTTVLTKNLVLTSANAIDPENPGAQDTFMNGVAKGKDSWYGVFENLPKYDGNGVAITYSVDEASVLTTDGSVYNKKITTLDNNAWCITNTPAFTKVKVRKEWIERNGSEGRPEQVTLNMSVKTLVGETVGTVSFDKGVKPLAPVVITEANDASSDTVWEKEIEIPYSMAEGSDYAHVTEFYYDEVIGDTNIHYTPAIIIGDDGDISLHNAEVTEIPITKLWDDEDDLDGYRPESITVWLSTASEPNQIAQDFNGQELKATISPDSDGQWTYVFKEVPAYDNQAQPIEYRVNENVIPFIDPNGNPGQYEMTVSGNTQNGFTVMNKHIPVTRPLSVKKVWDDADNQDAIRPTSISVQLHQNGQPYNPTGGTSGMLTLNENNNWSGSFERLPKFDEQNELYEYSVQELTTGWASASDYTTVVAGDMDTGFTLVNSHTPKLIDIPVVKFWQDSGNHAGKNSITVSLYKGDETSVARNANGELCTITLSPDNDGEWRGTFTQLPELNPDGSPIEYRIEENEKSEIEAAGYMVKISGNAQNGFVINNIDKNFKLPARIEKRWTGGAPNGVTEVSFLLTQNGEPYVTPSAPEGVYKTTSANGWSVEIGDLPLYDAEGHEYRYELSEVDLDEAYEASYYNELTDTSLAFIATNKPFTGINVTKHWNDNDNSTLSRPAFIMVSSVGQEHTTFNYGSYSVEKGAAYIQYPVWSGSRHVAFKFSTDSATRVLLSYGEIVDQPVNVSYDAESGTYHFDLPDAEFSPQDYIYIKVDGATNSQVISDLVIYNDDMGEIRSEPAEITKDMNWEGRIQGMPAFDATGTKITYHVEEEECHGYTPSISMEGNNAIITNNLITSIPVEKKWDNVTGTIPSEVTVVLLKNGIQADSLTLNEGTQWKGSFTNLQWLNSDGTQNNYDVIESPVPSGYTSHVEGTPASGYVITNSGTVQVKIQKNWATPANYTHPNEVSAVLSSKKTHEVELSSSSDIGDWRTAAASIFAEANEDVADGATISGGRIVFNNNSSSDEEMVLRVQDASNEIADTTLFIPQGTSTHELSEEEISGAVGMSIFSEDNNTSLEYAFANKTLSGAIILETQKEIGTETLSSGNSWQTEFTNLPQYDEHGNKIEYSVEEVSVEGFASTVTETAQGFTLTNSPEIDIPVKKIWEDGNDADGLRPTSIIVQLFQNGELCDSVVLTRNNNWSGVFTELPMCDEEGTPFEYSVSEMRTPRGYTVAYSGDAENGFTITNTHDTEDKLQLHLAKVWDDGDDADRIRPSSIEVSIYRSHEIQEQVENEETHEIETVVTTDEPEFVQKFTIDAQDGWTGIVTGLEKYDQDGRLFVYSVSEEDVPDGYTLNSVEEDEEGNFEITNIHTPEFTRIKVVKEWNDSGDKYGKRPASITVKLLADGTPLKSAVLMANESGEWEYTFDKLPKGPTYTVEEEPIPNYTQRSNTISDDDVVTIINDLTLDVPVRKTWNVEEGTTLPDSITYILTRNGQEFQRATGTQANNYASVFQGLAIFDENGREYDYDVEEEFVAGYSAGFSGDVANGFEVTNTPMTSVTVTKKWNDNNNVGNTRPASIHVLLMADNNDYVGDTILDATNNWTATFDKLPAHDSTGRPIIYTVEEEDRLPNYTTTYGGNATSGLTITNTLDKRPITIIKHWNDNDNVSQLRPTSIVYNIIRDDSIIGTVELTAGENWTKTIQLDAYYIKSDVLTEAEYSFVEQTVPYYTETASTVNGNTIEKTNSLSRLLTTARTNDGGDYITPSTTSIIDTVEYSGLKVGTVHTIYGQLISKETGSPVINSKTNTPYTAKATVTPANASEISGSIDLTFDIQYSDMPLGGVVVYETLYEGNDVTDNSKKRVEHADLTDENQTVWKTSVGTIAVSDNNTHFAVGDTFKIIDTVSYQHLLKDGAYRLVGTLHYSDGTPVLNPSTNVAYQIIKELNSPTGTETAGRVSGQTTMEFANLPKSLIEGTDGGIVVYEELQIATTSGSSGSSYTTIATHSDPNAAEQTVHMAKVLTTAYDGTNTTSDAENDKQVTGDNLTIKDKVVSSGLISGQTYRIDGTLVYKSTGETVLDSTSSKPVTASSGNFIASGSQDTRILTFSFDSSSTQFGDLVVYEKLYLVAPASGGTPSNEVEIASHEDINDDSQTVNFCNTGGLELTKVISDATAAAKNTSFPFTITFSNSNYTLNGIEVSYDIINTATGATVSTGNKQTIAENKLTLSLTGDQKACITGIPARTNFEVSEPAQLPSGWSQTSTQGSRGTIATDSSASASFTNKYSSAAKVVFLAHKKLYMTPLAAQRFTFLLQKQRADNADYEDIETIKNDASGNVRFSEINYTQADDGKDYSYKISEVNTGEQNIVYDTSIHSLKVHLADNGQGVLTATVTDNNNPLTKQDEDVYDVGTFTNYDTLIIPFAGSEGLLPMLYAIVGVLLAMLFGGVFLVRRRTGISPPDGEGTGGIRIREETMTKIGRGR